MANDNSHSQSDALRPDSGGTGATPGLREGRDPSISSASAPLDGKVHDGNRAHSSSVLLSGDIADAPLLARIILNRRRSRKQYLPAEMFGEPAWDMLLDLFIAWHDGKNISISSACIASGAPATTALRWLSRLETLKLVERVSDDHDRRRVYVRITDRGAAAIRGWLSDWNER